MQRKATKQSRGPSAAEKRFHAVVAGMPCVQCGVSPVQIHHIAGSASKLRLNNLQSVHAGHYAVLPLCPECHDSLNMSKRAQYWMYLEFLGEHDLIEMVPDDVRDAIAGEAMPW